MQCNFPNVYVQKGFRQWFYNLSPRNINLAGIVFHICLHFVTVMLLKYHPTCGNLSKLYSEIQFEPQMNYEFLA